MGLIERCEHFLFGEHCQLLLHSFLPFASSEACERSAPSNKAFSHRKDKPVIAQARIDSNRYCDSINISLAAITMHSSMPRVAFI